MNLVQHTFESLHLGAWVNQLQYRKFSRTSIKRSKIDLLAPLRKWLDNVEIDNSDFAHRICQLIPSQCPFEREIKLLGRTIVKIPPMCKLNPLYNEVIALRFRAICYLADICGEDVSIYC
ncbi:Mo-dependent nitrogenase C-terminal domain-containing protein [Pleurocapsales cyanobacterium LEGE 10410]|nr:Mo-dependent nitrogenase C-terminal domain-containing protein [Pleurocapsales cyanobacterium LEGE 10410]